MRIQYLLPLLILTTLFCIKAVYQENTNSKKISKKLYSIARNVNVRSEPGINSQVLFKIPAPEQVSEIERSGKKEYIGSQFGEWIKIKFKDQEGWAFDSFFQEAIPYSEYCHNLDNNSSIEGRIGYPGEQLEVSGLYLENINTNKILKVQFDWRDTGKFNQKVPSGLYIIYATTLVGKVFLTYCANETESERKKNDINCKRATILNIKKGCDYSSIYDFNYSLTNAKLIY